jgi:hypothetical protein
MASLEELLPRHITSDPEFQSARHFKEVIRPGSDTEYDWVCEHAKEQYERGRKTWSTVDDKANEVIKYVGGGTGLVTVGVLTTLRPETAALVAYTVPAIILSWVAVTLAALARRPQAAAEPPSIETAFHYANAYKEGANVRFLGQWHLACEILDIALRRKTALLAWSVWSFLAALALLLLPLAAGLWKYRDAIRLWFSTN